MAWIESHQSLRNHRKTKRLMALLGIRRVEVIGHLQALWWWSLENSREGFVADVDLPALAEESLWEGESAPFVDALCDAEFLERVSGGVMIHDWMEYAGKLVSQRKANAEKQQRYRERQQAQGREAVTGDGNVTVTLPSRNGATNSTNTTNMTGPDPEETALASAALPNGRAPALAVSLVERYEARLRSEPNRNGVLIDAIREVYGRDPDASRLGKMAATAGHGEFLRTAIVAVASWRGVDEPLSYIQGALNRRKEDGRTSNGRSSPSSRPVDRSSMSKIEPGFAEEVLASMTQNGKEARRESHSREPP